jgi:hypothetical protein
MHTAHVVLQSVVLFTAVFFTFDINLHALHQGYQIGLYLNATLLVVSLLVDMAMPNSIGKRLVLWLLYYELIAPLVFYFLYLVGTHSGVSYAVRFFVFYLCLPLLYFSHLTLQSIVQFLQDTPYQSAHDDDQYT